MPQDTGASSNLVYPEFLEEVLEVLAMQNPDLMVRPLDYIARKKAFKK